MDNYFYTLSLYLRFFKIHIMALGLLTVSAHRENLHDGAIRLWIQVPIGKHNIEKINKYINKIHKFTEQNMTIYLLCLVLKYLT